jgi:uncharacterized membrane protein
MIVIVGLIVLIAAAVVALAGVAANSGSAHPLGGDFAILGQHMNGLSTGQLFLWGIVVGVVGMLGLSLMVRPLTRRLASRGSRRELKGSRRETAVLVLERDRLAQQLDGTGTEPVATDPTAAGGSSTAGVRHRLGQHAGR